MPGRWLLYALAVVSALELAALTGLLGLLTMLGRWSPWLDLLNILGPLALVAAALTLAICLRLFRRRPRRRWIIALALVGCLAPTIRIGPEVVNAALNLFPHPPPGVHALRLLTLNVWAANVAPDQTLGAISRTNADVVLMQETNGVMHKPLTGLATLYPYEAKFGKEWACELKIFSKRPILASGWRSSDEVSPNRLDVAWLTIQAPDGRPVTLVTTHLGWPLPGDHQARQRRQLADYVASIPASDPILTGDMNAVPGMFAIHDLDMRLRPMSRRTHLMFSWPAYVDRLHARAPFAMLAIDQVYASPAWRTLSLVRVETFGSDHFGVLATFERVKRPR